MWHRIMARVREHPLVFLAGLVGLGFEIVADWLLHARYAWSYYDPHGSVIVESLQLLGVVLLLPIFARILRLTTRRQIVGYVTWSTSLALALAQFVTAMSGALEWSRVLGGLVALLILVDVFLAMRTSRSA